MGAILVALAVGMLLLDHRLAPWFPFLFATLEALGLLCCLEMLALLPPARRPATWLAVVAVALVLVANWPAHLFPAERQSLGPWPWLVGTFTAVVLAAFLIEMAGYREPGESVTRLALVVFITAYLGLLPAFLAQLRWLHSDSEWAGGFAVAMTVFVPKGCDIGAYLTGRLVGRSRMTPLLSPKKTWEGFVGGMAGAVLVAFALNYLGPVRVLSEAPWPVLGFGLTVGLAGVLGDLAESLIKRDSRQKDASQTVPGFGGVLDVVDSILFAAPVAYCWFAFSRG